MLEPEFAFPKGQLDMNARMDMNKTHACEPSGPVLMEREGGRGGERERRGREREGEREGEKERERARERERERERERDRETV